MVNSSQHINITEKWWYAKKKVLGTSTYLLLTRTIIESTYSYTYDQREHHTNASFLD